MAELLERHDLTDPSQHGWAVDYLIRREDGEQLHVEVRCWDRAQEAARRQVRIFNRQEAEAGAIYPHGESSLSTISATETFHRTLLFAEFPVWCLWALDRGLHPVGIA